MGDFSDTELIVALDVPSLEKERELVQALKPTVKWFKVGKELFTRYGPEAVACVRDEGLNVFLDLKYMDIPNTVEGAVKAAWKLGVRMVTVHTSAGPAVVKSAVDAAADTELKILGVTVLTSMDENELKAVGVNDSVEQQVERLACLAKDQGAPGIVCSGREIERIRRVCGSDFLLVVPGIRPAGSQRGDQKRAMTPAEAASAGADYIVVGRPVTAADNPRQAAENIMEEVKQAGAP